MVVSRYLKQEATKSVMCWFLQVYKQLTQLQHQTRFFHCVKDKPLQQLSVCAGCQQLIERPWQLCPLSIHDGIHAAAAVATVGCRIETAVAIEDLVIGWQD